MNTWANVGDLVFILGRNNEPVPCKVINEIGTGTSTQLFFEVIEDNDKPKVPKNKLKAFINQVGYAGGFVFKEKQNALDYLDSLEKNNGKFNMSSVLTNKTKRIQQRTQKTHFNPANTIDRIKEEATQKAISQVHKIVISAMLIALNTKLGIGPKRGAELMDEINRLIEEVPRDELVKMAEEKMKIKIG